jgi:hypothetical protein
MKKIKRKNSVGYGEAANPGDASPTGSPGAEAANFLDEAGLGCMVLGDLVWFCRYFYLSQYRHFYLWYFFSSTLLYGKYFI